MSFPLVHRNARSAPLNVAIASVFILACGKVRELLPPPPSEEAEPFPPPPSQETLQALETQYRTAVCERLLECGQVAGQQSCEKYIEFETGPSFTGLAQENFRQGRRFVFDADNAEQCLAAIHQKSCAPFEDFARSSLDLKECRETFKGTLKARQRCQPWECEPGTFCST